MRMSLQIIMGAVLGPMKPFQDTWSFIDSFPSGPDASLGLHPVFESELPIICCGAFTLAGGWFSQIRPDSLHFSSTAGFTHYSFSSRDHLVFYSHPPCHFLLCIATLTKMFRKSNNVLSSLCNAFYFFNSFLIVQFFSLTDLQNNFELLHSYFQPVLPPKRQLQQRGHLCPVRCRQKLDPRHERDVPGRRSILNPAEGTGGEPPTSDLAPRNPDLKRESVNLLFFRQHIL